MRACCAANGSMPIAGQLQAGKQRNGLPEQAAHFSSPNAGGAAGWSTFPAHRQVITLLEAAARSAVLSAGHRSTYGSQQQPAAQFAAPVMQPWGPPPPGWAPPPYGAQAAAPTTLPPRWCLLAALWAADVRQNACSTCMGLTARLWLLPPPPPPPPHCLAPCLPLSLPQGRPWATGRRECRRP